MTIKTICTCDYCEKEIMMYSPYFKITCENSRTEYRDGLHFCNYDHMFEYLKEKIEKINAPMKDEE